MCLCMHAYVSVLVIHSITCMLLCASEYMCIYIYATTYVHMDLHYSCLCSSFQSDHVCHHQSQSIWCHSAIRKEPFQAAPAQYLLLATVDVLFRLNFSICLAHHPALNFLDKKFQSDFAWHPDTVSIKDKLKKDTVTFQQTEEDNSLSLHPFLM